MEASKCADSFGGLPGHSSETSDAEQAYTQSLLGGTETWVRLPKERWPQEWIDQGIHDPVVPLLLALYGHPDSGGLLGAEMRRPCPQRGLRAHPGLAQLLLPPDPESLPRCLRG